MIHSSRYTAILDANVLYPAPLRDFLLRLASVDLYKPMWTKVIQEEWIRNLLIQRDDLTREKLENTCAAMDSAFPDANIINYEKLIPALTLPDINDRHVLAACIKAKADVIVTFNLKDFPADNLKLFDLEAQHPDIFVSNLISLDQERVFQALKNQVESLKKPSQTLHQVLETLKNQGLVKSVSHLNKYLIEVSKMGN